MAFDYAIGLDQPAIEGLSRHGRTQIYVTHGAGYRGPPMRIGVRPEVTVVELRSAQLSCPTGPMDDAPWR